VPGDDAFGLRWFTPTVEVDLCGHATLASAHALWTEGIVAADDPIVFDTRSGLLSCARDGERTERLSIHRMIWSQHSVSRHLTSANPGWTISFSSRKRASFVRCSRITRCCGRYRTAA
jgi:predicted PhzF superfamily epimerase YddE/YHI9